jgi:putative ABC transport system permease protein
MTVIHAIPLGWRQLRHKPMRLLVAVTGIGFAVTLILMQLGFRSALFESAVRYHERLNYDIALFSRDSTFIVRPESFSIRRLYQALAVQGVVDMSPIYIYPATWKNPWNHERRTAFLMGFDPDDEVLHTPGIADQRHLLRRQDVVLFDTRSRPEHGPVGDYFGSHGSFVTEVNERAIQVVGVFEMGTSFGLDASILTSETNFLRIFPNRPREYIDLGLVRVADGVPPEAVRDKLRRLLPEDVLALTKPEFVARETAYWNSATPIGYVFAFGAIMGLVVGAIIVYQILFADVSDHLHEYATLRALGYSNAFVSTVVVQQAVVLALMGFVPGMLVSVWLYDQAGAATRLPLTLTQDRVMTVLLMTVAMCAISGVFALRKVRRLDPAEVFR